MVSAFASDVRLVLAQEKVQEKSNEISAIPKLLKLFEVKGNTITIDAAGCQKAIAKQIVELGGDYVLALKGNQASLHEDVRLFLESEVGKLPLMAIVRHFTLNMPHKAQASFTGVGIKGVRKKAGWGNQTLRLILKQTF